MADSQKFGFEVSTRKKIITRSIEERIMLDAEVVFGKKGFETSLQFIETLK